MAETGYMTLAPLITTSEVKVLAFSTGLANFDTNLIDNNTIRLAALKHLKEPLGHTFFYDLVNDHNTGGWTTDSDRDVLSKQYLNLVLALFVKYECINTIQYRMTNKGIVTAIDEYTINADDSTFNYMKEDIYQDASALLKDMLWYLDHEEQNGKFPLYRQSKNINTKGDRVEKVSGILFYDSNKTNPLTPLTKITKIQE